VINTLPQLIEKIASGPTGGYVTVDSRYDTGYMTSVINAGRAFIIGERWKMYSKIPPIYYQKFTPTYSKSAQDDESCGYTTFYDVPDIIALDGRASGLGYIGSSNEINNFREVSSRAAFGSMMGNKVMAAKRKPLVLVEGGGVIRIYYRDKVKLPEMYIIASDPTQVPLYNINFDAYPMDVSDIPKLETYILQGSFGLTYKTPMDRINDGRDTTVPPPVRV
jgi:hypothetical protein